MAMQKMRAACTAHTPPALRARAVPGRHGACVPFPHRTATAPHHAAPEGMHIMISHIELLGRLLLAALLGSVIGLERERLNWAAGLRTHMLVCVGSALVMLVSTFGFEDVRGQNGVVLDPSRVAAQ
ncbi:MgtC/SapB family protein, partial [Burkholderia cenocepacia]|uniref:MgtC/SapB family protein n=1 Tax=Burkholderia cenocepacia TaxID=95486 RepID=UPI000667CB5F